MKKKFITYSQYGKIKKAVLDENLFKQLNTDPSVEHIIEYQTELLMEKRFAENLGINSDRKTLLG